MNSCIVDRDSLYNITDSIRAEEITVSKANAIEKTSSFSLMKRHYGHLEEEAGTGFLLVF